MRTVRTLACLLALSSCEGLLTGERPETPGTTGTFSEGTAWPAHLLTAGEYTATAQDLLGTRSRPADYFPAVSATEFDANVGVLQTLSPTQTEAVVSAARDLVDEVFASDTLRAQVVTCSSDGTDLCARSIITRIGRRAFRRPLDPEEVDAFAANYHEAVTTLELGHADAIAHVLRILLSSPSFFLRIERPGDDQVVLASRLSYLLWGSGPDDALLDAAERGELDDPTALVAQVDRLLTGPRGHRFTERFLGQWLGTVRLGSHNVDPTRFPSWNATLASAVTHQSTVFLEGFVTGGTPWRELFSAPHPDEPGIATLLSDDPARRSGFLTLPAYLTLSSHSDRTSPTARAKGVITSLFCTDMTPPPGVSTTLPDEGGGTTPTTVRARLEAHRKNPACAGCHNTLDPLGLSLENFDAIGRYRTVDEGQPIDASGTWQGTAFTDVSGLLPLLAKDPRLTACAPRKLFAYSMRRSLAATDEPQLAALVDAWQGESMQALLHHIVVTPAFRGHREVAP